MKKTKTSDNNSNKQSTHKDISLDKYKGTVGDYIQEFVDDWLDGIIASGELFKIDIYDLTRLMDSKNKLRLFERIDQLSIIDLVRDYNLDYKLIKNWIDRYIYYNVLVRQSNYQLVSKSNTNEQVALYYYLEKLTMINLDSVSDSNKKAKVLSFLFNRNEESIRKAFRNANIQTTEKKYYTESALKHILKLSEEVHLEPLKQLVLADLKRLYKK